MSERKCYRENEVYIIRPTALEQLKDRISRQYPRLKLLGLNSNSFFPPHKQIRAVSLNNGYTLYYLKSNALFIDTNQVVVPTLRMLWKHPGILRVLIVSEMASEYVLKGADLFSAALESLAGIMALINDFIHITIITS